MLAASMSQQLPSFRATFSSYATSLAASADNGPVDGPAASPQGHRAGQLQEPIPHAAPQQTSGPLPSVGITRPFPESLSGASRDDRSLKDEDSRAVRPTTANHAATEPALSGQVTTEPEAVNQRQHVEVPPSTRRRPLWSREPAAQRNTAREVENSALRDTSAAPVGTQRPASLKPLPFAKFNLDPFHGLESRNTAADSTQNKVPSPTQASFAQTPSGATRIALASTHVVGTTNKTRASHTYLPPSDVRHPLRNDSMLPSTRALASAADAAATDRRLEPRRGLTRSLGMSRGNGSTMRSGGQLSFPSPKRARTGSPSRTPSLSHSLALSRSHQRGYPTMQRHGADHALGTDGVSGPGGGMSSSPALVHHVSYPVSYHSDLGSHGVLHPTSSLVGPPPADVLASPRLSPSAQYGSSGVGNGASSILHSAEPTNSVGLSGSPRAGSRSGGYGPPDGLTRAVLRSTSADSLAVGASSTLSQPRTASLVGTRGDRGSPSGVDSFRADVSTIARGSQVPAQPAPIPPIHSVLSKMQAPAVSSALASPQALHPVATGEHVDEEVQRLLEERRLIRAEIDKRQEELRRAEQSLQQRTEEVRQRNERMQRDDAERARELQRRHEDERRRQLEEQRLQQRLLLEQQQRELHSATASTGLSAARGGSGNPEGEASAGIRANVEDEVGAEAGAAASGGSEQTATAAAAAAAAAAAENAAPDGSVQCPTCGKVLRNQVTLQNHILGVHDRRGDHVCPWCSKRFMWKSTLGNHVRLVHQKERPFGCDRCSERFRWKSHLDEHVWVVHEKATPFRCETCGKSFGRKNNMQKHMRRLHSGNGSGAAARGGKSSGPPSG